MLKCGYCFALFIKKHLMISYLWISEACLKVDIINTIMGLE